MARVLNPWRKAEEFLLNVFLRQRSFVSSPRHSARVQVSSLSLTECRSFSAFQGDAATGLRASNSATNFTMGCTSAIARTATFFIKMDTAAPVSWFRNLPSWLYPSSRFSRIVLPDFPVDESVYSIPRLPRTSPSPTLYEIASLPATCSRISRFQGKFGTVIPGENLSLSPVRPTSLFKRFIRKWNLRFIRANLRGFQVRASNNTVQCD